jgi:hypothetical protein
MRKPDRQESFIEGSKDDPKVIEDFQWLIKMGVFGLTSFIIMEFFPYHSDVGFAVATLGGLTSLFVIPPRNLPLQRLLLITGASIVVHLIWTRIFY